MFVGMTHAQLKGDQQDPCKSKSRVVSDATYCDRYWECVNGQPELYDCPNGLVFAGKHRGVTDGCDYPWRSNYCEGKQQASTYTLLYSCSSTNHIRYARLRQPAQHYCYSGCGKV